MSHSPIRILHVVTNMSYGGLENLLMNYYRHMDRNRIQFDFLTHVEIHQDFEEEIAALGGRLYRLPRMNPLSSSYRSVLHSFLEEHKEYRVIHSHLNCTAGVPLKPAMELGIPMRIAHAHSSNLNWNPKVLIKLWCKQSIPKYATHLFACGEKAGSWMFKGKEFTLMRNAIDVADFSYDPIRSRQMREQLGITGKFVLGHVGQFRQEKNHLFLIRVFHEVLKKEPNAALILVGKGPEMEKTKELCRSLGITDSVHFLGARPDIPDLMQGMDVFILPSLFEGLPVTMIEAQASGLPFVLSDRVPPECMLSETGIRLSLDAPLTQWADTVLSYREFPRTNTAELLRSAGYDVEANAKWLEEFYYNGAKN